MKQDADNNIEIYDGEKMMLLTDEQRDQVYEWYSEIYLTRYNGSYIQEVEMPA
jgi:hypothetical protein